MYNHYPNVSHRFPNSPLLHHQHAGVGYAPLQTPPLTPSDFTFCFKFGNVSVCSGCHQNFLPSDDLVIRHEEFRSYNSPATGTMASRFGNAYYHPRYFCITKKWPEFTPAQLCIPEDIMVQLTDYQKSFIAQEFGIQLI